MLKSLISGLTSLDLTLITTAVGTVVSQLKKAGSHTMANIADELELIEEGTLNDVDQLGLRHKNLIMQNINSYVNGSTYNKSQVASKLNLNTTHHLFTKDDTAEVKRMKQANLLVVLAGALASCKMAHELAQSNEMPGIYNLLWHLDLLAAYEFERRLYNGMHKK